MIDLEIPSQVLRVAEAAHTQGGTLVLVTGVFDVLHDEHKHLLQEAKKQGTHLVVGIESDARVKRLKGPNRPINDQIERQRQLEAWQVADVVFILPEAFNTPQEHSRLIELIQPDILAVSERTPHLAAKQKIMKRWGGRVRVVLAHNPAVSTTQLLAQRTA